MTQLDERRRSMSIRLYGLDQPWPERDAALDEIAGLTRVALGTDGAGVNLLVDDIQVTIASTDGHPPSQVPRPMGICSTVLRRHSTGDVIEIPDLAADPELRDNPHVDGTLASVRFYASTPLLGKHGLALGTLCAWSAAPMTLDDDRRALLRNLGRSVVNVLDERRRALVPDSTGALRPAR
ncbi:hypothetical protein ACXR2U_04175 [Jatrophihabitans sp. YIM 134969]